MADRSAVDVFAEERQDYIERFVQERSRVRVTELVERFGVSGVTIRKDLAALEQRGALVRTHGGAVAPRRVTPERGFEVRERLQPREKDAIGRIAAALVEDGESIALDASTTALAMARHLKARGPWLHLTVITNGLRIASELAGYPGITVVMPGGFVRWEALSLVGPLGEGLLAKVNIHRSFLGAAGFALESGLSDATEEEAQIKRLFVAGATEVVGLADHTKWGRVAFATFCEKHQLTAIVTDEGVADEAVARVRAEGIDVRRAYEPVSGTAAAVVEGQGRGS